MLGTVHIISPLSLNNNATIMMWKEYEALLYRQDNNLKNLQLTIISINTRSPPVTIKRALTSQERSEACFIHKNFTGPYSNARFIQPLLTQNKKSVTGTNLQRFFRYIR